MATTTGSKGELRDDQWAGRGDVHEQSLRGGLGLIASDVHNRFTYTATAVHGAGLTIRLMLQGEVDVQFPRRRGSPCAPAQA